LTHLAKLDSRVIAHLEGLRVAGVAGAAAVRTALADLTPAALFAASHVAFSARDSREMFRALQLALTGTDLEAAFLSALAWIDPAIVRPAFDQLCASDVSSHRRIGLSALVVHGLDATREIQRAAQDPDPILRALACRAVGETQRRDLTTIAERTVRDADPLCRFWARWCLTFCGDVTMAAPAFDAGWSFPSVRPAILNVVLRCGTPNWAREVVRTLVAAPDTRRDGIRALGIVGDPVAVPWLLEQFEDPAHARIAGEAVSMITGVDLEFLDLDTAPPETDDEDAAGAPDSDDANLPLPNRDAVHRWWTEHRAEFRPAQRYLAGHPVSPEAARKVLRDGYQRPRAAAAFELACLEGSELFRVDHRADWQKQRLAS
jgi:uncharacterized protein (TIGR02270 family)